MSRITKSDNAPLLCTDEMFGKVEKAIYYSKLDVEAGSHKIRIAPADVEKTALKTEYGRFELLAMFMCLKNVQTTFQNLMNSIHCKVIDDSPVIFWKELLIYSSFKKKLIKHLRLSAQKLKAKELHVKWNNNESEKYGTWFLGVTVCKRDKSIGDDRTSLVKDLRKPKSIMELQNCV